MLYDFSVFGKFWHVFMKKGKSNFIYGLLGSVFFFFKRLFKIKISYFLQSAQLHCFSRSSVVLLERHVNFLAVNPIFVFFFLIESMRPTFIFSSRVVRGSLIRIPLFFEADLRASAKVFHWLKSTIKTKNSLFFLLPQRLFFELVLLYKQKSAISSFKGGLHEELLLSRPNLRFLHKI